MRSAAPRRLLRLLPKAQGAVAVFALAGVLASRAPLSGQADGSATAAAAGRSQASAIAPANPVDRYAAPALPPMLVPPALNPDAPVVLQDGEPLVPVLFGIFGGIAGLFVADWWADRDCGDSCGQMNIAALFLGGALGAMLGWLVGGGDIPEESPPGRWP